jgi:ribosomal protein S3AE
VSEYERKSRGVQALGRAIGAAKVGKCKLVILDLESAEDIKEYIHKHVRRDYHRSYQRKYRERIRLKAKGK